METINSLKTSREFFLSFAKVKDRQDNDEIRTNVMSKNVSGSATVHQQVAAVSDEGHKDNDGCDRKSRRGEKGGLLLSTLGH